MHLRLQTMPENLNAQINKLLQHIYINEQAKKQDLNAPGLCLPEQSQHWVLTNIGPGLDSMQLNSSQLDSAENPRARSHPQAPTHKYCRIDQQNLYECKSALCYNRIQFLQVKIVRYARINQNRLTLEPKELHKKSRQINQNRSQDQVLVLKIVDLLQSVQ